MQMHDTKITIQIMIIRNLIEKQKNHFFFASFPENSFGLLGVAWV